MPEFLDLMSNFGQIKLRCVSAITDKSSVSAITEKRVAAKSYVGSDDAKFHAVRRIVAKYAIAVEIVAKSANAMERNSA